MIRTATKRVIEPVSRKAWRKNVRQYHVLAIESSCDDSSVALIDRQPDRVSLIDHQTESLDSATVGGIIPSDAKTHHQGHIGPIVQRMLEKHGNIKPSLVCATRGPGMMGSLSAGFNLAKGLALAWNVPLVGVHHMVGHLLTPRFFSNGQSPQFPFVSLLASGGHTMLVLSTSVVDHHVLANTVDIAVGDMLDKCGREIGIRGNMIGKEMEALVKNHDREALLRERPQDWKLPNPLQNQHGRIDMCAFSFAAFISATKKILQSIDNNLTDHQQLVLAAEIQRAIFHHLVSKVGLSLRMAAQDGRISLDKPLDFVCSGGVASNGVLRSMLQEALPDNLVYHFPEPRWCTDNALMIGWAGIELWENHGLHTDFPALSRAKWPIDELLTADCWLQS